MILCFSVLLLTSAPPRPIRIIEHKQLFSQTQEADGHDYYLSYYFDVFSWSLSVGGVKGDLVWGFCSISAEIKMATVSKKLL